MSTRRPEATESLREKLSSLLVPATNLKEGLLVSATYDGDKRLAVLKFYDPKRDRIVGWEDNTGHRPYCYTKWSMDRLAAIKARKDVVAIEEVQKLDLLSDSREMVRKIVDNRPARYRRLPVEQHPGHDRRLGGRHQVLRELRLRQRTSGSAPTTRSRMVKVVAVEKEVPETVKRSLEEILSKNTGEQTKFIREWADLLGQPLCSFKRIAMDIEVANEEGRIPDPEKADREVIAVSFHNDTESLVYFVAREGDDSLRGAKTCLHPGRLPRRGLDDEGRLLQDDGLPFPHHVQRRRLRPPVPQCTGPRGWGSGRTRYPST